MKSSEKNMPYECGDLDSLLRFTTVASAFIHSVLKKPLKSRRKVNHRKFLQKQLGEYSQYKSIFINNTEEKEDSSKYSVYHLDPAIRDSSEAKRKCLDGSEEQSLERLFNPDIWESKSIERMQSRQNCSLRNRQLPESFWKEPKNYNPNTTSALLRLERTHCAQSEDVHETFDFLGVEFDELLEKLSEDSDVLSTSSGHCTSLSDSCSVGGKEPQTPSSINSDVPESLSKSALYDQIWNVPADIVNNLTHADERYFF